MEKVRQIQQEKKVIKGPEDLKKKTKGGDDNNVSSRKHSNQLSLDLAEAQMKSQREYISQQLIETLDYSKIIVPQKIGVKYRPPKLGIEFYLKQDENFSKSLFSRRLSNESGPEIINDIDTFRQ